MASKAERQDAAYKRLLSEARELVQRVWLLERTFKIYTHLGEVRKSGAACIPLKFIESIQSDIFRSLSIQIRTLLDPADDVISLRSVLRRMKSELVIITQLRWRSARTLWGSESFSSSESFNSLWKGGSMKAKQEIVDALVTKVQVIEAELCTWISQSHAHHVKINRRSKKAPMEGNFFFGTLDCIKLCRVIINLLADIQPASFDMPSSWSLATSKDLLAL